MAVPLVPVTPGAAVPGDADPSAAEVVPGAPGVLPVAAVTDGVLVPDGTLPAVPPPASAPGVGEVADGTPAAPGVELVDAAAPGVAVAGAPGVAVAGAPGVAVAGAPGVAVAAAPAAAAAVPPVPGADPVTVPVDRPVVTVGPPATPVTGTHGAVFVGEPAAEPVGSVPGR
jgi:hypothetical protein